MAKSEPPPGFRATVMALCILLMVIFGTAALISFAAVIMSWVHR